MKDEVNLQKELLQTIESTAQSIESK